MTLSGTPRRRVMLTASLSACAAGLAGCRRTVQGDLPAQVPHRSSEPLISVRQLRAGIPVVVAPPDGGAAVVVVRTGTNAVTAFSATCPHRGCTVEMLHGDLVCPCHNSRFVPATGARIRGAAPTGLAPIAVRVADGQVWLS